MNIDEIIKLAREAGGDDEFTSPPTDWSKGDFVISPEQLSKFAALVRNAALEEAIKVIEEYRIPVGNSPAGELACEWTRDEALLRQALEALELRCGTNADERKELIPALRERLGEKA